MVAALKDDPIGWYEANGITPPPWFGAAGERARTRKSYRARHEAQIRAEHRANRWAHFVNIALGTWLVTQPPLIGVGEPLLRWSEIVLGAALIVFAALSLSWRALGALGLRRHRRAGDGGAVPVLDRERGRLSLRHARRRADLRLRGLHQAGPGPLAARGADRPETPPGWSYNPSTWTQRLPIIVLALVGLYVSRYLAAYQLGHVDGVWEPFFAGVAADPKNGTEEIITSAVSKAWPVSDAAVGGYTYVLEILTGIVGSRTRWRTMPWLVVLFGLMIAPLGIISIFFIIIQPIVIGTWSTLALIAAAAVLIQIPYSLDELLATLQFMRRRVKAGQSWLRVLLVGDTDEMPTLAIAGSRTSSTGRPAPYSRRCRRRRQPAVEPGARRRSSGLSLLFTRVTLGADGGMANADHLVP